MTTFPYDHVLTENMQTSAELILMRPQEEWSRWVQFLLAELESDLPAEQYSQLLDAVRTAIINRQATGSW